MIMGEINDSAQKIVQIINAADSIAFQTNILARNAAVEELQKVRCLPIRFVCLVKILYMLQPESRFGRM